MKVSELFEDPKDKRFISMMNQILGDIPELKQKKADFEKKISDIAAAMPSVFQKQRDLEAWMTSAVQAVMEIPNKMLQRFLPELKGLENEYREGTSILDMLSFHLDFSHQHERVKAGSRRTMSDDEDEWRPIVHEFIKNHGEDLEDCIRAVDHGFDAIRDMANKEKWPAPWQRYGKLPQEKHSFQRTQEELLYWIKELNTPNRVSEDGDGAAVEADMAKPNKKWKKILFKKPPAGMNPYKT